MNTEAKPINGAAILAKTENRGVARPALVFLFALLLGSFAVLSRGSDIRADPRAPGKEQATILATANGVPQVDIQTPSAAGVSRNQYTRFDVSAKGAILNNSHRQVTTRLGGWINGNPHLAAGEARLIVNEVNSRAPSRLGGPTEIAGRRAELVIANPAGIEVAGAGFINSAGTTLSTGRARFEGGALQGFEVREGELTIAGGGLDDRESDYTRLLARAFTLDGGIWAQHLTVAAGANTIAFDAGSVRARETAPGVQPALALDTGRLGGMYAEAIEVIATERGVGVNNGGNLLAGTGGLRIDVAGNLTNHGRLQAADEGGTAGTIAIRADSLVNGGAGRTGAADGADKEAVRVGVGVTRHLWTALTTAAMDARARPGADSETGVIAAAGEIHLTSAGAVENHGTIAARRVALKAKTLKNRGVLSQRGGQRLTISSHDLDNRGGRIGLETVPAQETAANSAPTAGASSATTAPRVNPSAASSRAASAAGRAFAALAAGDLAVTTTLDNRGGRIASGGALALRLAGRLDNGGGSIHGEKTLTASVADTLDNHGGTLAAADLTLRAATLNNAGGTLRSGNTLTATVADTLDTRGGTLQSAADLDLTAQRLDDRDAILSAGRNLSLSLSDDYTSGTDLSAGGVLHLKSAGAVENRHVLHGGKEVRLDGRRLANRAAGRIEGGQATRVVVGATLDNRGLINSNGETRLSAGEKITNRGTGRIYGDHIRMSTTRLENREETVSGQPKAAVIAARDTLALAVEELHNEGSGAIRLVAGQAVGDEASTLLSLGDLTIGGAFDDTGQVSGRAQRIVNRGARIEAGGDLHLSATEIANLNARFEVDHHVLTGQKRVARYAPDGDANWYVSGADGDGHWHTDDHFGVMVFHDGRPLIHQSKWSEEYYTTFFYADQLRHSEAGQILVGGDLHLDAARLENENSQILIGGALRQTQGGLKFTNSETLGKHYAADRGYGKHTFRKENALSGHHRHKTNGWRIDRERVTGEKRFSNNFLPYAEHSRTRPPGAPPPERARPVTANNPPLSAHTVPVAALLPNTSLFHYNRTAPAAPLIATDPAFTNHRRWLSSAYQLEALGSAGMMKRLGDGYYEQRLVNAQIANQTGYRRLHGYTDDERQYRALLDNGVTAARRLELVPGVALSAAQVARLQRDIVWLVAQSVSLPDGRIETVLAPRVYLHGEHVAAAGSLISAEQIALENATTLSNEGELRARERLSLSGERLANSGIIRGKRVRLSAADSIRFNGGTATAQDALQLFAKDIALEATTLRSGDARNGQTVLGRRVKLTVAGAPPGLIQLSAEQDIDLTAARLDNRTGGGRIAVVAGGDLRLGTIKTAFHEKVAALTDKNHRHHSTSAEIGSQITSRGAIELGAGKNLTIRQGQVQSSDAGLSLSAGETLTLKAGRRTEDYDLSAYSTEHGLFSKTSRLDHYRHHDALAVGSELSAAQISVTSGKDLEVIGSTLVGDEAVQLQAGQNLTLIGADEQQTREQSHITKKSGLINFSPTALTIGNSTAQTEQREDIHSARGSLIGSLNGAITLQAGKHYRQRGGRVSAGKGDLTLAAETITLAAAEENDHRKGQSSYRQSGLNVALKSPLIAPLEPLKNLIRAPRGESTDKRIQALTLANHGFALYRTGQAAAAATKKPSIQIALTYGKQKQQQNWQSSDRRLIAAQLHAGKTLRVAAAGAGAQSTLRIIGSDLDGGEATRLSATGALTVLGDTEQHRERSSSHSSGWNAGVAIDIGSNGISFGVTAGGNRGKGHGEGEGITWRNSHLGKQGTETVLKSGGSTTLAGAQVLGRQVTLESGGDLAIISRQDEASYHARAYNVSGQVTVGYGFSADGSYERTKIDSDYQSVGEQSGILAGDDGYQLEINGKTDLTGAAIVSTAAARAKGKNRLQSGRFTSRALENHASYRGDSLSVGGGLAISGNTLGQQHRPDLADQGANGIHGNGLGYGHKSDRQKSVTGSHFDPEALVLSGAEKTPNPTRSPPLGAHAALDEHITSATLGGYSGALENRFDHGRLKKELSAQTRARREFGRTLHGIDAAISAKLDTLQTRYKQDALSAQDYERQRQKWRILRGIGASVGAGLGAPSASAGGIIAAAASPLVAEHIGATFKARAATHLDGQLGKGERTAQALAHGLLAAGVAAAGGNNAFSAGLAAAGAEASAPLLNQWLYSKDDPTTLTKAEKTTLKTLAALGGAALGASGGESRNIAAASQLAENAVKNNYLFPEENIKYKKLSKEMFQEKQELYLINKKRDKEFSAAYYNCLLNGNCDQFYFLHVTQRKAWTKKGQEKFRKEWGTADFDKNWEKLPDSKSIFHNFDKDGKSVVKDKNGNYLNAKYVDRATGQYEVVLDKNNHIIKEETNAGTFNYHDPEKLRHHFIYDVIPYTDYGNGGKDKTDYNTRKNLSLGTRALDRLRSIFSYGISIKSQNAFKAVEKSMESK